MHLKGKGEKEEGIGRKRNEGETWRESERGSKRERETDRMDGERNMREKDKAHIRCTK
jgi:hypothetical protein